MRIQAQAKLLGAVLALALVTAACAANDAADTTTAATSAATTTAAPVTTQGGDQEPLVLGVVSGQTGFMSVFDIPVLQGVELAVAEFNAAGGILGRQIEIIVIDHKTDFALLESGAIEAIEAGADIIITSCDFDVGGPTARAANEQGVFAIGCAGGPQYGFEGIGPLTFNTYPGTPTEGAAMAEWTIELDLSRPYLLQDVALEYSKTVCDFYEAHWPTVSDTEIAGKETFNNDDPSIATQIARLKNTDADVVILCSYPPGGASAVRELRANDVELPIIAAGAFDGSYWLEAVPDLSGFYNPALGSMWGDDPDARRNAFFDDFEAQFGSLPASSTYPLLGYTAVEMIFRAAELGGSLEAEALRQAIESFRDEPLLVGPSTYTDVCHLPLGRALQIIETDNGTPRWVATIDVDQTPESPC